MPTERRGVVVGAGLLGLAAAHALSRRGWQVTVVEDGERIGHQRAGSKGSARIFRLGYPEPIYVGLALEARRLWHELERASGSALLHRTGQVTFGDEHALAAIGAALRAAGAPAEELSPQQVVERVPAMSIPTGPVLFEPDSGVLRADACLEALCVTGGFTVRTGAPAVALDDAYRSGRRAGAAVLLANGERLSADVVVDCAGPRALSLAGLRPPVAAPPSLPQVAYFASKALGQTGPPPVFIEWGDDMIYGLPVPRPASDPEADAVYKVSHHTPGVALQSDGLTDEALSSVDRPRLDRLCDAVSRLLPGLDPVPTATERCVYDNSADTDFVLDRVGNIVIGCGTSGHAFKFGPVLGALLADLAEGAPPSFDLARFALDRPRPGAHREAAALR